MFVGLVRLADLALPGMIERKWGRIISVISSGVIEPIPNLAISNAIRPALVGWGKTLANEVARHGITVNAVAPGRIATDRLTQLDKANAEKQGKSVAEIEAAAKARIPAGRYGTVEDYAAVAVFLASEAAGYVDGLDPAGRWRPDREPLRGLHRSLGWAALGQNVLCEAEAIVVRAGINIDDDPFDRNAWCLAGGRLLSSSQVRVRLGWARPLTSASSAPIPPRGARPVPAKRPFTAP